MKRLAALSFGCAAALLVLEVGCRLFIPRMSLEHLKIKNWPNPEIFQASNILPFELAPNLPGYSNSFGMRDRERVIAKPQGVTRIIFLGDSITMYGSFTQLLEKNLERLFPGLYEVWNCSVGGFGIREYSIQMRRIVPRYKPDLVIIAFCLNDLAGTSVMYYDTEGVLNRYQEMHFIPMPLEFWLYKHSYAYRQWLTHLSPYDPFREPRQATPLDEKAMTIIENEARRLGVPLRAVVFPWLKPDAEWTQRERDDYEKVTGLLKKRRVPYLDLSTAMPSGKRNGMRKIPEDHIHTNLEGDRLASAAILQFLRAEALVPAGGKPGAR